jgi:hypothetical protein
MQSDDYWEWMSALRLPVVTHRKHWEFAYVLSVMKQGGVLEAGKRALGFGVGKEPTPSLLARLGLEVVASDAPPDVVAGVDREAGSPQPSGVAQLHHPSIVDKETFVRQVSFRSVDMNAIADGLEGFDVCWSSCGFGHLGSIQHGLDFVENSLRPLRPGGLAVHTAELNLDSNEETVDGPTLSLFRRRDFEELAARLTADGHMVLPLNFHPGDRELDAHIDVPPFSSHHLKVMAGATTCTSFGIAVRKRAG